MNKINLLLNFALLIVNPLYSQHWEVLGSTYGYNNPSLSDSQIDMDINARGDIYVIGDKEYDSFSNRFGRVVVLKYNGTRFEKYGNEIVGTGMFDLVGQSVSLDATGDILAFNRRCGMLGEPGECWEVLIYKYIDGKWESYSNTIRGFSCELSADGRTIAVGIPWANDEKGELKVFHLLEERWEQKGNSLIGEKDRGFLGGKIALSGDGNTVISYNDDLFNSTFVIYRWNGLRWEQLGQIIEAGEVSEPILLDVDFAINYDGNVIIVGMPEKDLITPSDKIEHAGEARVYIWNGYSWIQRGAIFHGKDEKEVLGLSVDISNKGNIVVIGEPYNDFRNIPDGVGAAKVYSWANNEWIQHGENIFSDLWPNNNSFGSTVVMNAQGNVVVLATDYDKVL